MRLRTALVICLGACLGLGLGGLAGALVGSIPLLQPCRVELGPWSAPVVSPDLRQRVSTRMVSHRGSEHLPQLAWQADLTDLSTGEHMILELPGPPAQVDWEQGHTLVATQSHLVLALEWSGH